MLASHFQMLLSLASRNASPMDEKYIQLTAIHVDGIDKSSYDMKQMVCIVMMCLFSALDDHYQCIIQFSMIILFFYRCWLPSLVETFLSTY
jgi:hypothetical protein